MSTKVESAELLLKLYDLRREVVMRKAREWFITFNPDTIEDVLQAARGEHSAFYRMVTTYWDMACSFVNHGAIDEEMFNDANQEQFFIYAKIQPFVAEIRTMSGQPHYLANLEKLVMRQPDAEKRLANLREMARSIAARRAADSAERAKEEAAEV